MFKKNFVLLGVVWILFLFFEVGISKAIIPDPGLPDTVWFERNNSLSPSDTIIYHINFWTDSKLLALVIPLTFYNASNLDIKIDASSVVWGDSIILDTKVKSIDSLNKKANFGALRLMNPAMLEPGKYEFVSFKFISGPNWVPQTGVVIDSTFYPPASRVTFLDSLGQQWIPSVVVSGWVKGPAQICGDASNDGVVDLVDMVYLFSYCFVNGPAPPYPAMANCDGYSLITIRDIAYLVDYLFRGGPAPNCNLAGEYIPVSAPNDSITFSPKFLPASDSTVVVTIDYKNSNTMEAIAFPFKVKIGGIVPHIDSVLMGSRILSLSGMSSAEEDNLLGAVNFGFCAVPNGITPGTGTILSLYLSCPPGPSDRSIQLDTLRLQPANYPLFIRESDFVGVVPELVDFSISNEVKEEQDGILAKSFSLSQNYPNPFNLSTKIQFALPHSGFVSLNIYDVQGRKIKTLVAENLSSGYKSVIWEGKDDFGKEASSGVYFYKLKVGEFSETKKLVLVK